MKAMNFTKLIEKFETCPICGNKNIDKGEGSLIINIDEFERTCKCGLKVNIKELPNGSLKLI